METMANAGFPTGCLYTVEQNKRVVHYGCSFHAVDESGTTSVDEQLRKCKQICDYDIEC